MSLAGLLDVVLADPALAAAVEAAGRPTFDLAGPSALRPVLVAALAARAGRPVLAVTATGREAEDLAIALGSLLPPESVAEFPSWETLPHERLSPRADTVGRRLAVLRRLRHPRPDDPASGPLRVVVAPVRSLLQPQVPGLGDLEPVEVQPGQEVRLDELVRRLVDIAYHRVDLVERRGEFAVRGGILDVFPPTEEHPLRIELWGDTVEEVRCFRVADQRSLEVVPAGVWAPPCRELLLTADVRNRARELAAAHPQLADMFEPIAEGSPVEGMEALAPVLVDAMVLLVDELPAGTTVVMCDPERIRSRALDLVRTSQEFLEASWAAAASGGVAPIDLGAAAYRPLVEVREHAAELGIPWWTLSPFATDQELAPGTLALRARPAPTYRGDTGTALSDIRGWLADGWRVVVVTEGHGPAERIVDVLRGADVPARGVPDLVEVPGPGVVVVTTGGLVSGFLDDWARLAVLTETDLVGQRSSTKDMRRLPSRRRGIDPLQLSAGDFIVHEQHGVGRYLDLVQRTVQGATREYLVVEYAKGDRLFVPTDALDQVTRYVGGESPSVDRLGGAD
ncbi:MAG TPA: CarD family transcriptional regulator, partial [Mycobacteriales bacterium]|nr:CarD family transcriptional regulator [Mycobacteriales bacterium]